MMRSYRSCAAIAVALLALAASPSRAVACSRRGQSAFELYDLAATVAIVDVTAARAAGPIALSVRRVLKGDATKQRLVAQETDTSCHIGYRAGHRAIVFLDADGWAEDGAQGYIEDASDSDYRARLRALDAWSGAHDAGARLAVLLPLIAGDDAVLAGDAAYYLTDEVELLAALDPAQRDALVASAADPARPAHAQRELLRARLQPSSKLDAETDPDKLAGIIAAGTDERDPDRIAALERCERVRRRRLDRFTRYSSGASAARWLVLADACRTGAPAP